MDAQQNVVRSSTWFKLATRKWIGIQQNMTAAFSSVNHETTEACRAIPPHDPKKVGYNHLQGMKPESHIALIAEGPARAEHPHTNTRVINLRLELQRKYEDVEAMHRRAWKGYEEMLTAEHPYTLTRLRNLGSVLMGQGKYEEVEAMNWQVLELRQKVLGREHPDTLISLNNLGLVLLRQGQYEAAEALHWRALRGYENVLGVEHLDTLTCVNNLGLLLSSQGKYEEAEAMYHRALQGYGLGRALISNGP